MIIVRSKSLTCVKAMDFSPDKLILLLWLGAVYGTIDISLLGVMPVSSPINSGLIREQVPAGI